MSTREPLSISASIPAGSEPVKMRPVSYRVSDAFVPLLEQLGVTVLVSTYQSGHVVAIGQRNGQLDVALQGFEHAMGMALSNDTLAVGTRNQIWFLQSVPDLAQQLEPRGIYSGCYVARRSHFTGQIDCHEIHWINGELWVVNTLFSCLSTLDERYHFVPRWKPPFIRVLAAEDRCHLNGLAVVAGRPKYVTVMARTDTGEGWRPTKVTSGSVLDVPSGESVVTGLAMPHSPRWHEGRLWVLNSGCGQLGTVDVNPGRFEPVESVPGYTRGLAFAGPYAFVGLSKIRESAVFGGLPIGERRDELRCGVAVIDLRSGRAVAWFQFTAGVDEVFDVQIVPRAPLIRISGPHHSEDGQNALWVVSPLRS